MMSNQNKSLGKNSSFNKNRLKNIALTLVVIVILVLLPLGPEIYREFQRYRHETNQQTCFKIQKTYENSVKLFLEKNPEKLFSPGTIADAELTKTLLEEKLLQKMPECPGGGLLRIGSLDMSGAYVVSCPVHGSHDRPANINGRVTLKTDAGGTLIYDAKIVRDQADVLATYLLSAGILASPETSVSAEKKEGRVQIAFRARLDESSRVLFSEKLRFHADELARQVFTGEKVEFKLLPVGGGEPLIISTD